MLGPFIFKKTTIILCLLGEKQNDTAYALTKTLPIILFTMFLRLFLIVFGHFY